MSKDSPEWFSSCLLAYLCPVEARPQENLIQLNTLTKKGLLGVNESYKK